MIIRSIDFETTGIPTPDDPQAIVEAGWCDLPATDYASTLVNPGRPIPFEAMAVHHITDEMVKDWIGPKSAFDLIGGADIYVAHNADYERQFYQTDKPWICTWKVAMRVWPDLASHSLQFLRYALALPVNMTLDMPHRAGPDAYLCGLLFERIQSEPGAPDIDTMIRWSDGHALLPRCPLFKHKGKKWADVPGDYLDWIANKPNDVSADVKANARLELKRRASA
jgi:exodeoxyribonuclease X